MGKHDKKKKKKKQTGESGNGVEKVCRKILNMIVVCFL